MPMMIDIRAILLELLLRPWLWPRLIRAFVEYHNGARRQDRP